MSRAHYQKKPAGEPVLMALTSSFYLLSELSILTFGILYEYDSFLVFVKHNVGMLKCVSL